MHLQPRVATEHPHRLAIGAGGALGAAAILACFVSTSATSPRWVAIEPAEVARAAPPIRAAAPPAAPILTAAAPAAPPPAAAPAAPAEVMLVFRAGETTYMKLADLDASDPEDGEGARRSLPPHGRPRLVEDDGVQAAIAPVAQRAVPAAYAAWKGRKVKVDDTCEASVVGFAVVARLIGEPDYAGVDAWDAASVMKAGHAVLAAKLDRCTGRVARDSALPAIVFPTRLRDAALERAGRAALIASTPARETQRAWSEQGGTGAWHDAATISAEVLRHPRTGVTLVAVHGHASGGCGAPYANVWGLFRVAGDTLEPVQVRQLGEDLESIDALIDVEGDGDLELLGRSWLAADVVLTRADGAPIDRLTVPFLGCPC